MPTTALPLPLGSAPARSRFVSGQRIVNGFVEPAGEAGKSQAPIYACSGLAAFTADMAGVCRGMIPVNDALLVVSGMRLQSVSSAGAVTDIGPVSGSGYAQFARNANAETQTVILTEGVIYIYSDGALTRLIIPDVLENVVSVDWLDGYFIFTRSDGQFYISAINDTSVDALDFATAEADPDGLVRGFVRGRELMLMGNRTIEFWTNTGAALFPFARLPGAVINVGCGARDSVVSVEGVVFFVDHLGQVRRVSSGYQTERVSNYELERLIQALGDFSGLRAFTYTDKGHSFYCLTSSQFTWVFDASTGQWHERQTGLLPYWQVNSAALFAGKIIAGSNQTAKLYSITESAFDEAGEALVLKVVTPIVHDAPNGVIFDALELDFETGVGRETTFIPRPITVDTTQITADDTRFTADQTHDYQGLLPGVPSQFPARDPAVVVRWSDTGGKTWSRGMVRTLGRQSEFGKEQKFTRLGSCGSAGRMFEITIPAAVFRALIGAKITVSSRR